MTDSRKNEPTEVQVEAVARAYDPEAWAARDKYAADGTGTQVELDLMVEYSLGKARAALVAAQGAGVGPQEPCPQPCEHLSAEDAREGRDCREHPCTCPTAQSSDRENLIAAEVEKAARWMAYDDGNPWESMTDTIRDGYLKYAEGAIRAGLDALEAAARAAQGAAPQASKKSCGPCRRGQHGCCDGNEYLRCECSHGAAPVPPSGGVDEDALADVIASVTDLWDDPLDEVHDIPQIARAVAEWLKEQGR